MIIFRILQTCNTRLVSYIFSYTNLERTVEGSIRTCNNGSRILSSQKRQFINQNLSALLMESPSQVLPTRRTTGCSSFNESSIKNRVFVNGLWLVPSSPMDVDHYSPILETCEAPNQGKSLIGFHSFIQIVVQHRVWQDLAANVVTYLTKIQEKLSSLVVNNRKWWTQETPDLDVLISWD